LILSPSGYAPHPPMADKLTQRLLDSSFQYVQGKHAFETAITAARWKGWPDDEIARDRVDGRHHRGGRRQAPSRGRLSRVAR
jgi:hypothetical protein